MIIVLAVLMLVIVVGLLLSQRIHPVVGFTIIPVIFAFVLGASVDEIGEYISEGLTAVFPTAVLFLFAILFFGIMRERGLFEPIVRLLIKLGGGSPVRLYIATVLLATVAHLDGAGPATLLITVPALLPVYQQLGLSALRLLLFVGMPMGVMNMVPWGGPTARSASALGLTPEEIWLPLIPVQIVGILGAIAIAAFLGMKDRKSQTHTTQLALATVGAGAREENGAGENVTADSLGGVTHPTASEPTGQGPNTPASTDGEAPMPMATGATYWANVVLTVAVLAALFTAVLPLYITFVIGVGIALAINFRGYKAQNAVLGRHANDAIQLTAVLLSVSVFLGILTGTGMLTALTEGLVSIIPGPLTEYLHVVIGALGTPLGLFIGPDPYYFGMLPIVADIAATTGVDPAVVARALLIGENMTITLSPMIPAAYLAVGLAKVNLGAHIKHSLGWMWILSIVMLLAALAFGAITL